MEYESIRGEISLMIHPRQSSRAKPFQHVYVFSLVSIKKNRIRMHCMEMRCSITQTHKQSNYNTQRRLSVRE